MSIQVNNLRFQYDKKLILDDISIEFKSGEFVGILGSNGCGKSTLLKNILSILKPKSGIINIENKNIQNYSTKELAKIIGFVPQKSQISMPLLVEDVLLMGRYCHLKNAFMGYDKEDYAIIDKICELLNISHFKKRIASSLSGGEFQRVILARALISEPNILLLDEPTSALDLSHAVEIMKLCLMLSDKFHLLSVMVLHDINLASLFCQKLIMLKNGKIRFYGTPDELITSENLYEIYGLKADIITYQNRPFVALKKD